METRKLLFLIVLIGFLKANAWAADPIKMGYFLLPPHQYVDAQKDTGQPLGAAIEFFEIAASLMGEQVEWIGPLPLLRLVSKLKKGHLDGTVNFYRSPMMERYLYFADSPVFLAQPILMVGHDNPVMEIKSIKDIQGYHIGHVVTSGGRYTPLLDTHRDAVVLEGLGGEHWAEQNIHKLLKGRLDAIFDRQPYTLPFIAAGMNMSSQVRVLPIQDPPTPMYVVFSKASQRGQALLDRYNAILPKLSVDYTALAQQKLDAAVSPE